MEPEGLGWSHICGGILSTNDPYKPSITPMSSLQDGTKQVHSAYTSIWLDP